MVSPDALIVPTLGERRHRSPLKMSTTPGDGVPDFVPDEARALYDVCLLAGEEPSDLAFERAGPREHLFFEPTKVRAAIVTAGGLSPGINNVIRTLYYELTTNYGAAEVLGIRYGFQGLRSQRGRSPIMLTDKFVQSIHHQGGTVLGTSRGGHDPGAAVDFLVDARIDMLFCVGGDGTQRGAQAIVDEIARRKLQISVIGIPKTIDNDIKYCWRSFGFLTAVGEADTVIDRAHVEATGVLNGIGLVKLMGREAGFIAAAATLASGHVNFTLIPEVPFELEGEHGLLGQLERRLAAREHAVIVVAEGAGQNLIPEHEESYDASGNRKLADVGRFLKARIESHCDERKIAAKVIYFDPSYHIRSCVAGTADSLFCESLGRHAVHAAMAGKTGTLMGLWNNQFVHVPLPLSIGQTKRLSPEDEMWAAVLAITGQEKW